MYDQNADTKLVKAAYEFNLKFAAEYDVGVIATGSGSGSSAVQEEGSRWLTVKQQLTANLLPPAQQSNQKPGCRTFEMQLPISEALTSGCTIRFPAVAGAETNELTMQLPEFGSDARSFFLKFELSCAGAPGKVVHVSGYEVRTDEEEDESDPPPAAAPAPLPPVQHQPVQSSHQPPIPLADVHAQLEALNFVRGRARGNGDCFALSAMAGFEITKSAAIQPKPATTAAVRLVRGGAIDRVAGDNPIGGINIATFRIEEGLSADAEDAEAEMAPWRRSGFWHGDPNKFAVFMLGVSLELDRPVIVIERARNNFLNPARIYGARAANGELRQSAPRTNSPATLPSWFILPFNELVAMLQADPRCASLVEYNGTNHFDPWLLAKKKSSKEQASSVLDTKPVPDPPEEERTAKRPAERDPFAPDALDGEAEKPLPKAKKAKAASVVTVSVAKERKPLTIAEALDGAFAGLVPVKEAPEWLETALEPDSSSAKRLHGSHIAFHWEGEWGWAVGRLGAATKSDSNFSVLYEGNWREQQVLTIEAYGDGKPGSWLLLDGKPNVAPITAFKNGKYQVGDLWFRASELVHHRASDLEAARRAATSAKRAAEDDRIGEELAVGEHAMGATVYVKGTAAGVDAWFEAMILAHRERYPPIQVKYTATLDGETSKLALPTPQVAFVPLASVRGDKPSPKQKKARLR